MTFSQLHRALVLGEIDALVTADRFDDANKCLQRVRQIEPAKVGGDPLAVELMIRPEREVLSPEAFHHTFAQEKVLFPGESVFELARDN
jgi:hypothetical protein